MLLALKQGQAKSKCCLITQSNSFCLISWIWFRRTTTYLSLSALKFSQFCEVMSPFSTFFSAQRDDGEISVEQTSDEKRLVIYFFWRYLKPRKISKIPILKSWGILLHKMRTDFQCFRPPVNRKKLFFSFFLLLVHSLSRLCLFSVVSVTRPQFLQVLTTFWIFGTKTFLNLM